MRMLALLLAAPLFAAAAFSSNLLPGSSGHVKGEGDVVQRSLTVPEFHGIAVEGSIDVELTPSDTRSVTVEAQANLIDLVTTNVKDGVWHIGTKEGFSTDKPFTVRIALPMIDEVVTAGSGDVKSKGTFPGKSIALSSVGSGNITMDLDVQQVHAETAGSGDMKLSGKCTQLVVNTSGSGDVNARGLHSSSASVQVSGSGDVSVDTSTEFSASISGSGDVSYSGSPAQVHKAISGSGSVNSLDGPKGPR